MLRDDGATLWDALNGSTVTAWVARYSRRVSEAKQAARDADKFAKENAHKEAARQLWQQARGPCVGPFF